MLCEPRPLTGSTDAPAVLNLPEQIFPVGATLDGGRYRITERLAGERWRGRFVGEAADGTHVLVTTGGQQTVPLDEVRRSLAVRSRPAVPLLHVGPLDGGDTHAHRFHGMVELHPAGRVLAEVERPLARRAALALARDLARALHSLHDAGLALGELPSELVHVRRRITRWTVAALVPRAPRFWRTCTQPNFALPHIFALPFVSPEVLWGRRPGPSSDVFVVALYVVWLLTGEFPYPGGDYVSRLMAVQANAPIDVDLDPDLQRVVVRAFQPDPAQRPSLRELASALTAR